MKIRSDGQDASLIALDYYLLIWSQLDLIHAWQVYEDGFDLSRPTSNEGFEFDPALLLVIHACIMEQAAFEEEMNVKEAPEEVSIDLDTALVLKKILIKHRDLYGTSIAEDVSSLRNDSITGRTRMAIEVRLGEKEILAAALDSVQRLIADQSPQFSTSISSGELTTEASATKRQKI